jgi:hypothetical protein
VSQAAGGGVRGYAFDECWRDYQMATIGVLLSLIVTDAVIDFSSPRGSILARAVMERTAAMLVDDDAERLLATGLSAA